LPQVSPQPPQLSQPLLQQLCFLNRFRRIGKRQQLDLQLLQPLLQPVSQQPALAPHEGAAQHDGPAFAQHDGPAAPHAGAAQQLFSATHEGSTGAQQLFWPQPPQLLPQLPQPLLQQPRSNKPRRPENRQQRFLQQLLQPVSQQPALAPHDGSQAAAQVGPAFAQHDGPAFAAHEGAAQHDGAAAAQQLFSAAQHDVSQQLLLQQPRPSIRSNNVAPNVWLQRPMVATSAPSNMFHFIDRLLLYSELRAARRSNFPAAHATVLRVAEDGSTAPRSRLRGLFPLIARAVGSLE
jgi:hypothetical protein